jgi:hypothetical protein
VITGMRKPWRTVFSERDYQRVRELGLPVRSQASIARLLSRARTYVDSWTSLMTYSARRGRARLVILKGQNNLFILHKKLIDAINYKSGWVISPFLYVHHLNHV